MGTRGDRVHLSDSRSAFPIRGNHVRCTDQQYWDSSAVTTRLPAQSFDIRSILSAKTSACTARDLEHEQCLSCRLFRRITRTVSAVQIEALEAATCSSSATALAVFRSLAKASLRDQLIEDFSPSQPAAPALAGRCEASQQLAVGVKRPRETSTHQDQQPAGNQNGLHNAFQQESRTACGTPACQCNSFCREGASAPDSASAGSGTHKMCTGNFFFPDSAKEFDPNSGIRRTPGNPLCRATRSRRPTIEDCASPRMIAVAPLCRSVDLNSPASVALPEAVDTRCRLVPVRGPETLNPLCRFPKNSQPGAKGHCAEVVSCVLDAAKKRTLRRRSRSVGATISESCASRTLGPNRKRQRGWERAAVENRNCSVGQKQPRTSCQSYKLIHEIGVNRLVRQFFCLSSNGIPRSLAPRRRDCLRPWLVSTGLNGIII